MKRFRSRLSFVVVFCCLLVVPAGLFAQQQTISGIVTDSAGTPLQGATVAQLNEKNLVLRYAFTGSNGQFTLAVQERLPITVMFVGYRSKLVAQGAGTSFYRISLQPDMKSLQDITIRSRPMAELHGDTLSYLVKTFSTKEDRSIGDVLRRLPGVEISADGTIYFNGKKIENLYIDGDDLMDGRYGMATRVIKKELIRSVDIINHHQPVNVLKNKVFTDNIAVNLVLMDENSLKLSATSTLGLGLPAQMETSIAPVLLNKKIKMVDLAGYNNAGLDYRNDVKQLGTANFLEAGSPKNAGIDLSLSAAAPPDIPLGYYYFNSSSIAGMNAIYKNKRDVQFKFNANNYSDKNTLDYNGATKIFLGQDTITYFDQQALSAKPFLFNAAANLLVNKNNFFLSNALRVSVEKQTNTGDMNFNGYAFSQMLQNKGTQFSNDFSWVPALKNKAIAAFRWLSAYGNSVAVLEIGPGYFFDIDPQKGFYDLARQQTRLPSWFNHAYLSYKIPGTKIFSEYQFGITRLQQQLGSALELIKAGVVFDYAGDPGNDAKFRANTVYLDAHYQLKFQKLRSDIHFPLSYRSLTSSQAVYTLDEKQNKIRLLPDLSLAYNFDNEKSLRATYQLQNLYTDITRNYAGAILLNYRALRAYAPGFQEQSIHRAALVYTFQKAIKLFYANAGLNYEYQNSSALLSDSVSGNIRRSVFVPYPNHRSSVSANLGLSQYINGIKTTLGLKLQTRRGFNMQLINQKMLRLQSDNFTMTVTANKKMGRTLAANYMALFSAASFRYEQKLNSPPPATTAALIEQKLKMSFNLFKQVYVESAATQRVSRWSAFDRTAYFFLDATLRRRNLVKGLDAELNCINLFNVTEYSTYFQDEYQFSSVSYPTRGISFLLRATYSF